MQDRITVLLDPDLQARFSAYCLEKGHKKSTLIARLIREHLDGNRLVVTRARSFSATPSSLRKGEGAQ